MTNGIDGVVLIGNHGGTPVGHKPKTDSKELDVILKFVLELRNNSDWKDENILAFLDMMQSRMNICNIERDIKNQEFYNKQKGD